MKLQDLLEIHIKKDVLNEGKGYTEASKLIKHLREKVYRNLNDQELEEFTKEMVEHLGGTLTK